MEAAAVLAGWTRFQRAFEVIGTLMLTAFLFPRQAIVNDLEQFDFIVVGAGSAGSAVAARLADSNFQVLLVDAGGDPPLESLIPDLVGFLPHSQYDWIYTTEYDKNTFQCQRSRAGELTSGHLLGGGSSMNFMFYVRGCPGDFASWAAAANDNTWGYDGVLPYFIKSEKLRDEEILNSPQRIYHGTEGYLGVTRQPFKDAEKYLDAFRELGHDIILDVNADAHLGYQQPMFTIADGVRQSTAYTVLGAFKNSPNLHVLKKTFVTKIIFDDNNNAIGIEAITNNNKEITLLARKEVVVSAGALSTPRLLMLSGIGPKQHLESLNILVRSDLPVGMNLQDHLQVMVFNTLEKSTEPPARPRFPGFSLETLAGYVALNKTNKCPDYQTLHSVVPHDSLPFLTMCLTSLGFNFDICKKFYEAGIGRKGLFSSIILLHPKSRGQVLLRSTDPKDPPLINGGYLSDDGDLETIVDSMMDFVKIFNTSYFKSVNAKIVNPKMEACPSVHIWSREWWRCYVRCMMNTIYHYSGTAALGAVVDGGLRVWGTGRLRVVDASVMPELVGANTNAATIMIGEKAADIIKQDHGVLFPDSFYYYFYRPLWKDLSWLKK